MMSVQASGTTSRTSTWPSTMYCALVLTGLAMASPTRECCRSLGSIRCGRAILTLQADH
jgi:hypothetical protein